MAHACPNQHPSHRANSRCGCQCIACLIGSRNDLADDLEEIGRAFDEKVKKLQAHYDQALQDAMKKLRP